MGMRTSTADGDYSDQGYRYEIKHTAGMSGQELQQELNSIDGHSQGRQFNDGRVRAARMRLSDLWEAIRRPDCSPELLMEVLQTGTPALQRAAAEHPNCPRYARALWQLTG